jgi:hypothetical protein
MNEQKWISVDEKPKEKGSYLGCTKNGGITIVHWYGHKWGGGFFAKHMTHWMPLPEPPNMKGE